MVSASLLVIHGRYLGNLVPSLLSLVRSGALGLHSLIDSNDSNGLRLLEAFHPKLLCMKTNAHNLILLCFYYLHSTWRITHSIPFCYCMVNHAYGPHMFYKVIISLENQKGIDTNSHLLLHHYYVSAIEKESICHNLIFETSKSRVVTKKMKSKINKKK